MAQRSREVRIFPDIQPLFHAAASDFASAAQEAVATRGSFSVALSGGSTPRGLFSLMAEEAGFREQIPWDRTFFFWGDERHVPPDDAESNFRMARESLLSHLHLRDDQVLRIHGECADAAEAARDYEHAIRQFFALEGNQLPRFDLVLLGMGPDGHTASLFPGTKALRERKRIVVANWVGKLYAYRITMTAPVLNAAAHVLFLVSGQDKAPALKAVLEGPREPLQLPAQLIQPRTGSLVWLVDQSAGQMLEQSKRSEMRPFPQPRGTEHG